MNIRIPKEGIEATRNVSSIEAMSAIDPIKLLWGVRDALIKEVLEYVGLQIDLEISDLDYQRSKIIKVTLKPLVKKKQLDSLKRRGEEWVKYNTEVKK